MTHEIIQDHSPFYIQFTHAGLDRIIDLGSREFAGLSPVTVMTHHIVPYPRAGEIISLLPLSQHMSIRLVSLRIAAPGYQHHVHIDGACASINFGIHIQDDLCETRWYCPQAMQDNFIIYENETNRAWITHKDFESKPQQPVKSFTMQQGQAVLFNSGLYHDFDNSRSPHARCILTLRLYDRIPFNMLKKIMFGDVF